MQQRHDLEAAAKTKVKEEDEGEEGAEAFRAYHDAGKNVGYMNVCAYFVNIGISNFGASQAIQGVVQDPTWTQQAGMRSAAVRTWYVCTKAAEEEAPHRPERAEIAPFPHMFAELAKKTAVIPMERQKI